MLFLISESLTLADKKVNAMHVRSSAAQCHLLKVLGNQGLDALAAAPRGELKTTMSLGAGIIS